MGPHLVLLFLERSFLTHFNAFCPKVFKARFRFRKHWRTFQMRSHLLHWSMWQIAWLIDLPRPWTVKIWKPLKTRIIETWTPTSTVPRRPWTSGRWVWLTYGDLTYQWLPSIQTWTPMSVFCRPQSQGLWVPSFGYKPWASGTSHELRVQTISLDSQT